MLLYIERDGEGDRFVCGEILWDKLSVKEDRIGRLINILNIYSMECVMLDIELNGYIVGFFIFFVS